MLQNAIFVYLLLVPFCFASDHFNYEESHDEVRDFVSGGMLHVRMSVGDLRVTRSESNRIRLHYTVKSRRESAVRNAHVEFEVHGRDATIELRPNHRRQHPVRRRTRSAAEYAP